MNKIKTLIFLPALILVLFSSCKMSGKKAFVVNELHTTGLEAVNPYLTHDNQGNAVLCWTEKSKSDSLYRLNYAVYNPALNKFGKAITVSCSAGTNAVAESMNKVAFKNDGTAIAVFGKHFDNEKNRWAGAICYSMSSDGGKRWSQPKYIHSDTAHTYSRSFFDIAALKNGEVGAIWLDGRYGKSDTGSALFFNQTRKGKGFGTDKCIIKNTCECCRTELLSDDNGTIHAACRAILFPPSLLGKQVRDMVYTFSKDNGKTFATEKRISQDNWAIEGCPHTGPSLAVTGKEVDAVWFTAGGTPGLYYSHSKTPQSGFGSRNLLTSVGRHPQIISLKAGNIAMVCEEDSSLATSGETMMHGKMESINHNHSPAANSKIILRIIDPGKETQKTVITSGRFPEHHAVIAEVNNGLLLAWVKEAEGTSKISYSFIKTD